MPRRLAASAEACEPWGSGGRRLPRRPAGPPGRASVVRELLEVLGVRVAVIGGAEPEDRDVLGLAVI